MNTNYKKWCNLLSFQLHNKLSEILGSWNSVCICNYHKALMQYKIVCDWLMFWIVMLCFLFLFVVYLFFYIQGENYMYCNFFQLLHYISCTLFSIVFTNFVWESRFFCSQSASFYIWPFALPQEKAMAAHSSTLAWKTPWTEEPGRLQSMGSLRVWHNWATSLSLFTFMLWRRKWQPTPVFLPGESQGWGSLVGCCLWDHTELDTTEVT